MIVVDTSVWIAHFGRAIPALVTALETDQVLLHPFVLGELTLGGLSETSPHARKLQLLRPAPVATAFDVIAFIRTAQMVGTRIGYVDVHLLASARQCGASVMTEDNKLRAQAERLGIAFTA